MRNVRESNAIKPGVDFVCRSGEVAERSGKKYFAGALRMDREGWARGNNGRLACLFCRLIQSPSPLIGINVITSLRLQQVPFCWANVKCTFPHFLCLPLPPPLSIPLTVPRKSVT